MKQSSIKIIRTLIGIAVLLILVFALVDCGGGGGGGGYSAVVSVVDCATVTPNATVSITDNVFGAISGPVSVNGIVKWTNNGIAFHTVTSGATWGVYDGKFNSGNVSPGASVCFTFLTAGTHPYYCANHAGMTSTLTVQ